MLWKVRIHMRQKLALAAIFCLVMITIVVAVIRYAVVSKDSKPEQTWLYFWNNIETTIGKFIQPSLNLVTIQTRLT